MIPHDILTLYSAKMVEYGIAVLFLLLFIPFWQYVQGTAKAPALATAHARKPVPAATDWFMLPVDRLFHRGHAWLMAGTDGVVTVGMSDFAAKLVGPLSRVSLPEVGTSVGQGELAWRLVADDGRTVDMLSPVDGTVVEVNPAVTQRAAAVEADPYANGWLLKVRPSRLRANQTNLLSGAAARRWMDEVMVGLRGQFATDLGTLSQDGGAPLSGMARAIAPEQWDELAASFLLTDKENRHA
ncbi:MAG: glycine cleavage system protein H [Acidobacteria bacterium]|nr:glycine cleavage system protein H [Acidobacteriota bacterium]